MVIRKAESLKEANQNIIDKEGVSAQDIEQTRHTTNADIAWFKQMGGYIPDE